MVQGTDPPSHVWWCVPRREEGKSIVWTAAATAVHYKNIILIIGTLYASDDDKFIFYQNIIK